MGILERLGGFVSDPHLASRLADSLVALLAQAGKQQSQGLPSTGRVCLLRGGWLGMTAGARGGHSRVEAWVQVGTGLGKHS